MPKGIISSQEEFVKAWCTSQTKAEVAEKLNITENSVYVRAYDWRKRGINLPKLQDERKNTKLRVNELNNLIKQYK